MKLPKMLVMVFLIGCAATATAQRPKPKATKNNETIVGVGTKINGETRTRILRLEYQLRILANYNPGAMRVHTVFPGGPATRMTLAGTRKSGTLEPGDIITHVDGRRIYSRDDYYLAMYLSSARNGRVRINVRDVNTGRFFRWEAVAEKVGGGDRDRPIPKDARTATRVKALVICQTKDKAIGKGCESNADNLELYLRGLPKFDEKTDLTVLTGNNVTARNILRTVSSMRVGSTETLFCYVAGHGGHDPSMSLGDPSGGHFFQFDGGDMMRRDLLNALRDKGAQMTVLMTDTCNVRSVYQPPPRATLDAPGPLKPEPIPSKVFEDLLYNHVGVVDVSGSSRGEFGWYQPSGGWFTVGLLQTLEKSTETDGWKPFLEETSKNVSSVFQSNKRNILASREPAEEGAKKVRRLLEAQKDQHPQTFRLAVRRVER